MWLTIRSRQRERLPRSAALDPERKITEAGQITINRAAERTAGGVTGTCPEHLEKRTALQHADPAKQGQKRRGLQCRPQVVQAANCNDGVYNISGPPPDLVEPGLTAEQCSFRTDVAISGIDQQIHRYQETEDRPGGGVRRHRSSPFYNTFPAAGLSRPVIILIVVVLPVPLAPRKPKIRPDMPSS